MLSACKECRACSMRVGWTEGLLLGKGGMESGSSTVSVFDANEAFLARSSASMDGIGGTFLGPVFWEPSVLFRDGSGGGGMVWREPLESVVMVLAVLETDEDLVATLGLSTTDFV